MSDHSRAPVIQDASIKAGCMDCAAPYPFGLDLVLPDQQWNHIVPDGAGLLCPACIAKRASKLKGATVILAWIDHFDWTAPRPVEWFTDTKSLPNPQPDYKDLWEAFVAGAKEARLNPAATEKDFNRAADAYCKLVHSKKAPEMFEALSRPAV